MDTNINLEELWDKFDKAISINGLLDEEGIKKLSNFVIQNSLVESSENIMPGLLDPYFEDTLLINGKEYKAVIIEPLKTYHFFSATSNAKLSLTNPDGEITELSAVQGPLPNRSELVFFKNNKEKDSQDS